MTHYVAIIHKDADSDYGVSFPDFPGCVTAGTTLAEAALMATEALSGHVDLMVDEGQAIPEPSDLDTVMLDPDFGDGVPVLVAVKTTKTTRAVRVNITLPADVLERIDAYAEAHGLNRSGFLAQAAKREMDAA